MNKITDIDYPVPPLPPPNRIYKMMCFGVEVETEESKLATTQWHEQRLTRKKNNYRTNYEQDN